MNNDQSKNDQDAAAAEMTARLEAEKARLQGPPRKPDPKDYGWQDGAIRNTYTVALYLQTRTDEHDHADLNEWLELPSEFVVNVHARSADEVRDKMKTIPLSVLQMLGIKDAAAGAVGAEEAQGANIDLFVNGGVELKHARVLTEEDVYEFFGDVPLSFSSHYKQEWVYEGRKDHYVITWSEIATDHRYSVDVKQPITIDDRGLASCQIVDERSNLIVFECGQRHIY